MSKRIEPVENKRDIHRQFLVTALGYWGRGETLVQAAENCRKAGAGGRDRCVVALYTNPDANPDVATDGFMVQYNQGTASTVIGVFNLGALLRSKGGAK